jgi:uncharacterized membrane-anchored protein YitT (DUF2179 family)
MRRAMDHTTNSLQHRFWEDIYALCVGSTLLVLGLFLLKTAGLVTGGAAGLALLISYASGWAVGVVFTVINVPLLVLTARLLGFNFVIKTIAVNIGVLGMSSILPGVATLSYIHPAFAAIAGGCVAGMGALALARHGAGTSGSGAIILWLYQSRGLNAGKSQIAMDTLVLLASFFVLSPQQVGWSLVSVAAIAGIMFAWHRPGRYAGY